MTEVRFYNGFQKRVNSTKQPETYNIVQCTLKEDVSVLRPTFVLNGYYPHYNYCWWEGRYYFVTDIEIMSNHLYAYHCKNDPLATYKEEIGNSRMFVTRSASRSNGTIYDGLYPALSYVEMKTTFPVMPYLISDYSAKGVYILGVVNGETMTTGNASSAISYYMMIEGELRTFMRYLFSSSYLDISSDEISENLQKALINPFQYIVSCKWFPISMKTGGASHVKFGWWESDANGILLDNPVVSYSTTVEIPEHPQSTSRGAYLNSSPYTEYSFSAFNFGMIPIDPAIFSSSGTRSMRIGLDIDLFSGRAILLLADSNGNRIGLYDEPFGADVPLSQSVYNPLSAGASILGGILSGISGNIGAEVSGIMNGINEAIPQVQINGSFGSRASYVVGPVLTAKFRRTSDENEEENGRPLMRTTRLGDLEGYIKVENPDSSLLNALLEERQEVDEFLSSGIFYE